MFQILLWSPWKYRCGQRTVRLADCGSQSQAVFARRRSKSKLKLLDIRAELERRENARGHSRSMSYLRYYRVRQRVATQFLHNRKRNYDHNFFNHIIPYQRSPMLIFEDCCFHFDNRPRLVGVHKHASVRARDTQNYASVHALY
ncbi:hypothetical protein TNCV_1050951 [Trichonephila clavipes]|nr:hypothetical protein TNCV_1050951 [Trichonephila clavipes]